jgi:hypothetical protein
MPHFAAATRLECIGVETCLGKELYPTDPTRTMIALQPVLTQDDIIANSVSEIDGLDKQSRAVIYIAKTMMEILVARTVTTDVQPLLSQQTDDVLFFDLTQAKVLASGVDSIISVVDLSLASSFVSEMLSRIPEPLQGGRRPDLVARAPSRRRPSPCSVL